MVAIKAAKEMDQDFWFTIDTHLSVNEFMLKVRDKRAFIIKDGELAVGILRYNLFWDTIPFLNLIYLKQDYQNKGYGRSAMRLWEKEMLKLGYKAALLSTQVDEDAQHFYRKLGYKDAGCLVLDIKEFEQPLEMFMIKKL